MNGYRPSGNSVSMPELLPEVWKPLAYQSPSLRATQGGKQVCRLNQSAFWCSMLLPCPRSPAGTSVRVGNPTCRKVRLKHAKFLRVLFFYFCNVEMCRGHIYGGAGCIKQSRQEVMDASGEWSCPRALLFRSQYFTAVPSGADKRRGSIGPASSSSTRTCQRKRR